MQSCERWSMRSPPTALATIVEPVCSVDDDPSAVSREDKAWQKLHRQTIKEPHKARLRAFAAERRREAALEAAASLPTATVTGTLDEADAIFKTANNNGRESSLESFGTSSQTEENYASSPTKLRHFRRPRNKTLHCAPNRRGGGGSWPRPVRRDLATGHAGVGCRYGVYRHDRHYRCVFCPIGLIYSERD